MGADRTPMAIRKTHLLVEHIQDRRHQPRIRHQVLILRATRLLQATVRSLAAMARPTDNNNRSTTSKDLEDQVDLPWALVHRVALTTHKGNKDTEEVTINRSMDNNLTTASSNQDSRVTVATPHRIISTVTSSLEAMRNSLLRRPVDHSTVSLARTVPPVAMAVSKAMEDSRTHLPHTIHLDSIRATIHSREDMARNRAAMDSSREGMASLRILNGDDAGLSFTNSA